MPPFSIAGAAVIDHLNPSARGALAISPTTQVPFGMNKALLSKINCWFLVKLCGFAFATVEGSTFCKNVPNASKALVAPSEVNAPVSYFIALLNKSTPPAFANNAGKKLSKYPDTG